MPPTVDPAAAPTTIPNVSVNWARTGHRPSATFVAPTAVWNPVHDIAETYWKSA